MTEKPSRTSGADRNARKVSDPRAALDRLAEFARKIVAVPKDEVPTHKPAKRTKRRKT